MVSLFSSLIFPVILSRAHQEVFIDKGGFSNRLRHVALWGSAGGVLFVYMSDWRVVLGRIPFVKGRFQQ